MNNTCTFLLRPFLLALLLMTGVMGTAAAKDPKPLFTNDDVLNIRIEAPFKELKRAAARSTEPYPATLIVEGDTPERHAIMLSPRGNSRRTRDLCTFPPLRVTFPEKPESGSLFEGQKGLKLVTHCRNSSAYQQYYLLEYTAYKLFNVITPQSLHVRMAAIDYVEADSGKTDISRFGFFIEDTDDTAKRNDMKEIDTPDIDVSQLDTTAAARYALFQYMIGNLDWSMHNGPDGDDCCHNTKLLGVTKDAQSGLIPVPYDFDYSGLVDTPYAVAPPELRLRSVRSRRYRGFCAHNSEAQIAAAAIRQQAPALHAAVEDVPELNDRNKRGTHKYLDVFFEDIETDEQVAKKLLKACRD